MADYAEPDIQAEEIARAEAADTMRCEFEGCPKTMRDGVLWRVNPKGVPGIFMCKEHAQSVNSWGQRGQSQVHQEGAEE